MFPRVTIALPATLLWVALFAVPVPAQIRGMRAPAPAPHTPLSFRLNGRASHNHQTRHRYFNGFAYYPDYESDYEPGPSVGPSAQTVVMEPARAPVPAASPVESLILEERNGQWVRIPTGKQLPVGQQVTQSDSARASTQQMVIVGPAKTPQPTPELPPAVLVFRDGHIEEIKRYMIQGGVLYAGTDYWSTGSWTRKILIAELDVPASLKLNAERSAKFTLPSGPNVVVVRF